MNKTSSIITIGREYGSGGRQIGQEVANYFGIKCYDKEGFWNTRPATAVSVKNYLSTMTRNLPTVFFILLLWIRILSDILLRDLMRCQ